MNTYRDNKIIIDMIIGSFSTMLTVTMFFLLSKKINIGKKLRHPIPLITITMSIIILVTIFDNYLQIYFPNGGTGILLNFITTIILYFYNYYGYALSKMESFLCIFIILILNAALEIILSIIAIPSNITSDFNVINFIFIEFFFVVLSILIYKFVPLNKLLGSLIDQITENYFILAQVITITLGYFVVIMYYKLNTEIDKLSVVIFVGFVLAQFIITLLWSRKNKIDTAQKLELQMQLNNKKLEDNQIDRLRATQHKYNNNLMTLMGLQFIEDRNELNEALNAFIDEVSLENNLTTQILRTLDNERNSVYRFIRLKLFNAQEKYRQLKFSINLEENLSFDSKDILNASTILGVLLDNTVEHCTKNTENNIIVSCTHNAKNIIFTVENPYKGSEKNLNVFFQKGYTTKENEKEHGYGLYESKSIADKNKWKLFAEMKEHNGKNYICFNLIM